MNDKVVIAGTVKLRNTIKAKTNLHNVINGTPSWVVNTGGGGIVYPHYSGSYTVTPSGSVQVLDTSDKVMDDDVTVQAVQQGSATTPATIITADPTISVSSGGLITATVSKTQQVTPTVQEGYVETGTPGNVGVSGSNTEQLSVQSAQTIHPASTDQSIASGKYLTGAQTFKAVTVTGLTADKVLQGTTVEIGDSDDSDRIMKVVGTAQGGITPTGTKQINIASNGTTTEDVTNYASAEITVNVSGGGGATTLASGTFVGNNGSDSSIPGRQEFSIGSKMAQTDFGVLITAPDGADIAKSTSRKYIWMYYRCENIMGGFDLSSDGNKAFVASSYSVDSEDSGTITTRAVASLISFGKQLYNGSVQNMSDIWFQIRKYSDHFGLAIGMSNAAYMFTSECTYSWKVVYFGSNPSTDIVEIV